jgi:hypothetical protein
VAIDGKELTLGMIVGSRKLADVRRDPRVEIHAAPVASIDGPEGGDAKVAGTLVTTGPTEGPEGTAFRLDITLASQVRVEGNELVFLTWRPGRGVREIRRH